MDRPRYIIRCYIPLLIPAVSSTTLATYRGRKYLVTNVGNLRTFCSFAVTLYSAEGTSQIDVAVFCT